MKQSLRTFVSLTLALLLVFSPLSSLAYAFAEEGHSSEEVDLMLLAEDGEDAENELDDDDDGEATEPENPEPVEANAAEPGEEAKEPEAEETEAEPEEEKADKVGAAEENEPEDVEEPKLKSIKALRGGISLFNSDFEFITGVELTDMDGNPLGSDVGVESEFKIRYTFVIPNENDVDPTEVYNLQLPNEIKLSSPYGFELFDDGVHLADIQVNSDGSVDINFTDAAAGLSGVKGYFELEMQFDPDKLGDGGPREIVVDLGQGRSQTVNVDFEDVEVETDVDIKKSGVYNASEDEVTWTVDLTTWSKPSKWPIENVVVTDSISDDQTYVINSASITKDGASFTDGSFSYSGGVLTYDFTGDINTSGVEKYQITFKTKPKGVIPEGVKNGDIIVLENRATVTFDADGSNTSKPAKVDYKEINLLDKSSEGFTKTEAGYVIDWKVIINESGFDLKDVTITDVIYNGHELVIGSFKLDGTTVDSSKISSSAHVDYVSWNLELGDIDKEMVLTYQTIVKDFDPNRGNEFIYFDNTVNMTEGGVDRGSSYDGQGIGQDGGLIYKEGYTYEPHTQEIIWYVVINSNKVEIEDAVFTDTMPEGLSYVNGSLKYVDYSGGTPAEGAPVDGVTVSGATISKNFGTVDDTIELSFRTKVVDPNLWAKNASKTFYNTAYLTGKDIENSDSTGEQGVTSKVLEKTGVSFDYVTNQATWKIVVNQNKMEMTNVVIVDEFDATFEFVDGSITGLVSGMNYSVAGNEITFELGNIDDEVTITFKTEIIDPDDFFAQAAIADPSSKKVTHNNSVVMTFDQLPGGSEVSGDGIDISNKFVNKKSNYKTNNDYIDWIVEINQNRVGIEGATLEDTLQEGLMLDTSSVELYKATVDSSGAFTLVEPKINVDFSYDAETRLMVVELGDISEAYILKFTTDVDDAYRRSSFVNTINFTSISGVEEEGKTDGIWVDFATGSGGITGTNGSITVVKVDEDDNEVTLSGAIFELYDHLGNRIRISDETGEDGKAIFDKLKFRTYVIKEVQVPDGYLGDLDDHEVTITSEDKDMEYTITNKRFAGVMTEFTAIKLWEGGDQQKPGIWLQLFKNGNPEDDPVLLEGGEESYTWPALDMYDDKGNEHIYSADEVGAPQGYVKIDVSKNDDGNYVITNRAIEEAFIEVNKTLVGRDLLEGEFTFNLYDGDELLESANNNADGTVEFSGFRPGAPGTYEYTVVEETGDDSEIIYDGKVIHVRVIVDEEGNTQVIYLDEAEEVLSVAEFVNVKKTYAIGDYVWIDDDRNGLQDDGEVLEDVRVELYYANREPVLDGSGNQVFTFTDENGRYLFDELEAGNYRVKFVLSEEQNKKYRFTKQVDGNEGLDSNADPVEGENYGWSDAITLDGSNSSLTRGYDDQDFVATEGVDPTWDAGVVVKTYALGDYVWIDSNKDGLQDEGEEALEGVTVELYDEGGELVASTVTDVKGKYLFDNLEGGKYKVKFILTDEQSRKYRFTKLGKGTDDDSDADENGLTREITLDDSNGNLTKDYAGVEASEGIDPTWDAGVIVKTYAIGDYVWVDSNRDGVQDKDEKILAGVKVELFDKDGKLVATTVTDKNGKYKFDELEAGEYKVKFTLTDEQAKKYRFTKQGAGSDDRVDSNADDKGWTQKIVLNDDNKNLDTSYAGIKASEGIDPTWDAGVIVKTYAIGDKVWIDSNKNGVQDGDEKPLEGVKVELYDKNGKLVATTVTDKNGNYKFDDLEAGEYRVKFTLTKEQARKYEFTSETVGKDGKVDSNAGKDGWTKTIVLDDSNTSLTKNYEGVKASEGIDPSWDAGVVEKEEVKGKLPSTGATPMTGMLMGGLGLLAGAFVLLRKKED